MQKWIYGKSHVKREDGADPKYLLVSWSTCINCRLWFCSQQTAERVLLRLTRAICEETVYFMHTFIHISFI